MAEWQQTQIPGGHVLHVNAETPDGKVCVIETWEHICDGSGEVAGSRRAERSVWLNDIEIGNPDTAAWLLAQVMRLP